MPRRCVSVSQQTTPTVADPNRYATELASHFVERSNIAPEQVGKMLTADVGQTPSEVIHQENKVRLHRYEPETVEHETPLVLVYALINKPYIMDLQPGLSVIQTLMNEGFEVYLIDWGEPSRLDQSLTFEDYVTRYMDNCIDKVRADTDVDDVHLLGYCMGGTMATMYTTLYQEKVKSLSALALAFNFDGDSGIFETWAQGIDIDQAVDTMGNLPQDPMAVTFTMKDPVNNYVTRWLDLWDRLEEDAFIETYARIERWSWDGVDITGGAFRQFIGDIVQDNKLAKNEFYLGDTHVDIEEIEVPVAQIIGLEDKIAPPASSKPLGDMISSEEYQEFEFPSGHFGVSMSPPAHQELWPNVADWIAAQDGAEEDAVAEDAESEDAESEGEVDETTAASTEDDEATMAEDADSAESDAAAPVEELDGIGPTYAERLENDGIETAAGLAAHDAEELATVAETNESAAEKWLDQVEDVEPATDDEPAAESTGQAAESGTNGHVEAIESISGIGPTYAERLEAAGIETPAELAEYDPDELADIAETNPSRTEEWLDQIAG